MDEIDDLEKDEIDYLRQSSAPRLSVKRCKVDEELLNIEIILEPHEFKLIHISYKD